MDKVRKRTQVADSGEASRVCLKSEPGTLPHDLAYSLYPHRHQYQASVVWRSSAPILTNSNNIRVLKQFRFNKLSQNGTLPHGLPFPSCIRQRQDQYDCRSTPPTPQISLSSLLAFSGAWRTQLLSASSRCHLTMKLSEGSATFRYHFTPFFSTVGHNAVSTANTKGKRSVGSSLARNALISYTRHWVQFFAGRPVPGLSRPPIVPIITGRVSLQIVVRCMAFADRSRHSRMVVSTSWHCAS